MDIEKLDHVELFLENCEKIIIPGYLVRGVEIRDVIRERIDTNDFDTKTAEYLKLTVINDRLRFKLDPLMTNKPRPTAYDRLLACDVTGVTFFGADGADDIYHVVWPEFAEWRNYYQSVRVSASRTYLYITFDRNKLQRIPYIKEVIRNWLTFRRQALFRLLWKIPLYRKLFTPKTY